MFEQHRDEQTSLALSYTPPSTNAAEPEASRVIPEQAGTLENKSILTEPAQPEWIPVNDAQEQFRLLGLPRSVEAIRKYCRQGKLEAEVITGPRGDQHMINRASINVFVEDQLKVLNATSHSIPVRDGSSRQIPVQSVTNRFEPERTGSVASEQSSAEIVNLQKKIEKLEAEKRDLEIDKEVRTRMNAVLEGNNEKLLAQVTEISKEAQEWSRKFGRLEERVQHLQLVDGAHPQANTDDARTLEGHHASEPRREKERRSKEPPSYPLTADYQQPRGFVG